MAVARPAPKIEIGIVTIDRMINKLKIFYTGPNLTTATYQIYDRGTKNNKDYYLLTPYLKFR